MSPGQQPSWLQSLCTSLRPIREGFAAEVMLGLMESGIYAAVEEQARTAETIARDLSMRRDRVTALIHYAVNEELLVEAADGRVSPAPRLSAAAEFRPWFEMLVGGYGKTLADLPRYLAEDNRDYAPRDLHWVGRGSTGISQYDTLPMVRRLIAGIGEPVDTAVDIGCADAAYLIDLCGSGLAKRGIGLELDSTSLARGREAVKIHGLDEAVELRAESAGFLQPRLPAARLVLHRCLRSTGAT